MDCTPRSSLPWLVARSDPCDPAPGSGGQHPGSASALGPGLAPAPPVPGLAPRQTAQAALGEQRGRQGDWSTDIDSEVKSRDYGQGLREWRQALGWGEACAIETIFVVSGYTGGLKGTQPGTVGATWFSGQRRQQGTQEKGVGTLYSLTGHGVCRGRAGSPGLSPDPRFLTINPRGRQVHLYPTIPSKGHL